MLRAPLAFAAALLLPFTSQAAGTPAAPVTAESAEAENDRRFEQLLRLIDSPIDRRTLDETIVDAKSRLLAAAASPAREEYARLRAISLLGQFPEADVRAAFETLRNDPVESVRGEALLWLGRTFGQPGDATLVSMLAAGANDTSELVRDRAVRALRWVAFPSAGTTLDTIAKTHADESIRQLARVTAGKRTKLLASGEPRV